MLSPLEGQEKQDKKILNGLVRLFEEVHRTKEEVEKKDVDKKMLGFRLNQAQVSIQLLMKAVIYQEKTLEQLGKETLLFRRTPESLRKAYAKRL